MKKVFAMILIMLCLLNAAALAETWTIAPIETPEGEPIGISPDGSTMLFRSGEGFLVKRNGELKPIVPNYERGVEDTYGNFEKCVSTASFFALLDETGVTWSPDGRYFVLTNWQEVMVDFRWIRDLILFDTEKGECFLADTDGNQLRAESAGCVLAANFGENGEYLDFVYMSNDRANSRMTLERYEIGEEKVNRLARFARYLPEGGLNYILVGIQPLSGGRYLMLRESRDESQPYAFDLFRDESKENPLRTKWKERLTPLPFTKAEVGITPYQILANPNTKYALLFARGDFDAGSAPLYFRVNVDDGYSGSDECLMISQFGAEKANTFAVSAETREALRETLNDNAVIANAALS
ncbi:MAG: hypothetical protein MR371_06085, partial [Clostridia bacterium]|nr:hypothetical protein [Clostridia bacterium]